MTTEHLVRFLNQEHKTVSSETAARFGDLSGQNAVITGASSGIGRAIAQELAAAGANVQIHARSSMPQLVELATQIAQTTRVNTHCVLQDLAASHELEKFVEDCWNRWNGVDIWVNNAGVDLLTGTAREWSYGQKLQALLDVDVRGTLLISKLIGSKMQQRGTGVILNIGWDQADRGMEGDSGELFATAKNAIMGFSRSLAVSLAPQVRVNCIAPGWIRTAWGAHASETWQSRVQRETPLGRWGEPEDIAKLARFLCSAEASYLTGQVWNANGGAVR